MGLLLLGLVLAGLLLTGPIALAIALAQRSHLNRLQRDMSALRARPAADPSSATAARAPEPAAGAPVAVSTRPSSTSAPGHLERIIGGQWLTWIGVLTIFFGTAFFLAYDLGEHPLSGVGQILVSLLVATAFGVVGTWLTRRAQQFLAQGLLGGSTALLFLSAYAAYGFHRLVPALAVYPFLVAVTLVGAWIAITANSLTIATLTLVGAIVTPHVLDLGGDPSRVLFPYLLAVTFGAAVMGVRRSWPLLPLLAFVSAAATLLMWWQEHFDPHHRLAVTATVAALWLLHLIVPLMTRSSVTWRFAYSLLVVANAAAVTGFCYRILAPNWTEIRGVLTAGIAFATIGASRLFERRSAALATYVTYYTGIAVAVAAVPIHFDAEWTTLVWALFGYLLFETGIRFPRVGHRVAGLAVLLLTGGRLLIESGQVAAAGGDPTVPVLNAPFAAGLVVVGAFIAAAFRMKRSGVCNSRVESALTTPILMGAFVLLWWHASAETIAYFHTRTDFSDADRARPAVLALSWMWAAYAGALITGGFLTRYRPIRFLGVLVLAVLVLKVFLFDMQFLDRGDRIASFVGVGVLLLVISLLYQRGRKP